MFKKPVSDELSFVTWCAVVQDATIRRCGHKTFSGKLWCLNDAQWVPRGPKCGEKIFHAILRVVFVAFSVVANFQKWPF